MNNARSAILARLRATPQGMLPALPEWRTDVPSAERLDRFCTLLEASHAEVVTSASQRWPALLAERLKARGNTGAIGPVLYAPGTAHGRQLAEAWADQPDFPLVAYDRPVEELKETLVHGVGAAVTGTMGGIAETGSLILWPTRDEPRLMSLLPPLHIALVDAGALYGTLTEAMIACDWAAGMPTNALLISGPSKTADIEQTLAYGVHGPKELMVIVLDP
ncbi:MAG: lactate utilization protein [Rhodospirillales bacterium]|nr:lactate utilization protein [Rhodospirillales bacterium]